MDGAERDVALFRYSLIREAADDSLTTRQRGVIVRELAGETTPVRVDGGCGLPAGRSTAGCALTVAAASRRSCRFPADVSR